MNFTEEIEKLQEKTGFDSLYISFWKNPNRKFPNAAKFETILQYDDRKNKSDIISHFETLEECFSDIEKKYLEIQRKKEMKDLPLFSNQPPTTNK